MLQVDVNFSIYSQESCGVFFSLSVSCIDSGVRLQRLGFLVFALDK